MLRASFFRGRSLSPKTDGPRSEVVPRDAKTKHDKNSAYINRCYHCLEYPSGSVSAAEATGELASGTRNRWFVLATNNAIDWGFVLGSFVPWIVVLICKDNHLRAAWRISLGLGAVSPALLFVMRLWLKDPEEYLRNNSRGTRIPAWLVVKYYWFRLVSRNRYTRLSQQCSCFVLRNRSIEIMTQTIVGLIWFMYDFSTYAFGIYSTTILTIILGDSYVSSGFLIPFIRSVISCPRTADQNVLT